MGVVGVIYLKNTSHNATTTLLELQSRYMCLC